MKGIFKQLGLTQMFRSRRHSHRYLEWVNILSFAVAISLAFLIHLYVRFEQSYDRFYDDSERIFRVVKDFYSESGEWVPDAYTQPALAPAMKTEIGEIEQVTRLYQHVNKVLSKVGEERFYLNVIEADSTYFQIFNHKFTEGSGETFYRNAHASVITESTRKRMFGNGPAVGKTIEVQIDGHTVNKVVGGVIPDLPANSHFHFDMLIPLNAPVWLSTPLNDLWDGYNWYTYFKLGPDTDIKLVKGKMLDILERKNLELKARYYFQPLVDIHLHSNLNGELEPGGSHAFVRLISVIKYLLLATGIVNFLGLLLVSLLQQLRDLSIKKIHGATNIDLLGHYITKTILMMVIIGTIVSVCVYAMVPLLNQAWQSALIFSWRAMSQFLLATFVFTMVFTLAVLWVFIAKAARISTLACDHKSSRLTRFSRYALTTFQFFVAITIVTCVLIIREQITYSTSKDIGFNKDGLLVLQGATAHPNVLKEQLLQVAGIKSAAFTTSSPGDIFPYFAASLKNSTSPVICDYAYIDQDYFDLMGIGLITGQGFKPEIGAKMYRNAVVINRTAERMLGLSRIGDQITPNPESEHPIYFEVIGVVDDFHTASFHDEIRPTLFFYSPVGSQLALRLITGDFPEVLNRITSVWKSVSPDIPMDFFFVDNRIDGFYKQEVILKNSFSVVGLGCLVIACSGLVVVCLFSLRARRREMCIRRVVGASDGAIYRLFTGRIMGLIILSILLSIPTTKVIMSWWLSNFTYHVTITMIPFLITGILMICIVVAIATFFSFLLVSGMRPDYLNKE